MLIESTVYGNNPVSYALAVAKPRKRVNPLAQRLFEWRSATGLTQDEFMAKHGIGQGAMSKWETGSVIPKLTTLLKLLVIFDKRIEAAVVGLNPAYDSMDSDLLRHGARDTTRSSKAGDDASQTPTRVSKPKAMRDKDEDRQQVRQEIILRKQKNAEDAAQSRRAGRRDRRRGA